MLIGYLHILLLIFSWYNTQVFIILDVPTKQNMLLYNERVLQQCPLLSLSSKLVENLFFILDMQIAEKYNSIWQK